MSSVRVSLAGVLVGAALAAGCASNSAPPGFLLAPAEAQKTAWGGWITVEMRPRTSPAVTAPVPEAGEDPMPVNYWNARWDARWKKGICEGELIAIGDDSVYVQTGRGLAAAGLADVANARLTGYDAETGRLSSWAALGTLSTASHGFFALISLPIWVIAGSAISASQSHKPVVDAPDRSWADMRQYARFPQGLPPGLERGRLRGRPPL